MKCNDCEGKGKTDCGDCEGTGTIDVDCDKCISEGTLRESGMTIRCPECNGEGRISEDCPECDGEGQKECEACGGSGEE